MRHVRQNTAVVVMIAALLALGYGIYRTNGTEAEPSAATHHGPANREIVVDQSSLVIAEQLVHMPTTADERRFAEDALRTADNEMDLAFAQAVRRTFNLPRATSAAAKEAEARLQQALHALAGDQARDTALTAALRKSDAAAGESLSDQLNLVRAQTALDQDDADDARQDLRRAGGDPQGRMQDVIAEHEAASKSSDSVHVVVTAVRDVPGLIGRFQALESLHAKESLLHRARAMADSLAAHFKERHDSVEARAATFARAGATANLSHDSSAVLLASAQRRASDGKLRATLDQRVDNQRQLSDTYAAWATVLTAQERNVVNQALRAVAVIFAIILAALLLTRWIEHVLGTRAIDRRRMQTLYMVTRVSMQVVAVLLVLLVIFGPPNNLGTILGLVGAGLTVALKDFILGFAGWFVLMGRNGIRIGDLVEINGVTGEVIELGMFYTALLETGDWTESGHPTGRRVAFTNGFAIEGHYFNFSTSGRWLWDDVRIIVPAGRDPYAIADQLRKQVEDATGESAREAQEEWKEVRRSSQTAAPAAAANVNLRPIAGGVEITVRYITRPADRDEIRGKLYHTAVDLLGGVAASK
ncbi:MAG: mechanosensitive ion channel family protein [Gemmatimonadales bacterium]